VSLKNDYGDVLLWSRWGSSRTPVRRTDADVQMARRAYNDSQVGFLQLGDRAGHRGYW
jgi:hypothetical protein